MMARQETGAERTRRCRRLFERALIVGCTPTDLLRRDAEQRWRMSDAKLAAKRFATSDLAPSQPWMMRD
jgi:hypothetical protein